MGSKKPFRSVPSRFRTFGRYLPDVAIDASLVVLCLALANTVTSPRSQDVRFETAFWLEALVLGTATLTLLLWRKIYRVNVRYFGLNDFLWIALTCLAVGLVQTALPVVDSDPRRTLARTLVFSFSLIGTLSGVRIVTRYRSWRADGPGAKPTRGALIVGAGDAGEMIMRELVRNAQHRVVGFADDDPAKASTLIDRVPVLGTTDDIPNLVREHKVEEVFIAIPSAAGAQMRRIIDLCHQTDARVKTLPPLRSLMNGNPHMSAQLREVEIEDLLRREPVHTDLQQIAEYLGGERVMITGGGGSIGSELARQIANLSPASLILLGKGENSVYEIEQELLHSSSFQATCVIADVRDREAMEAAFEAHRPTVVFHAAAHKHVPLMEGNPIEAVRNNVQGTWRVTELATKCGAKRLIYVSTDKAVHPSSVMGATKRVGEMIVSSYRGRTETECAIVRFGNVLGSRGSLIPTLKAQILRGGPVRVTHAEMTRYFMTIPEAVQLILQAGALGERGEVFLLEMGEPVRILDLAQDLIRLHGLVPGKDVPIIFTGVRPGEKLHEELLYASEQLSPTRHPAISMVRRNSSSNWEILRAELEHLLALCETGDADEVRRCLMELAWGKTVSGAIGVAAVHAD